MLWIAVALPRLPLETLTLPGGSADLGDAAGSARPCALLVHARIVLADGVAHALGVRPGLTRAHALALAPDLQCLTPSPEREKQAFEGVALALMRYTPHVVLADQHTVLLEVAGGLRLFGGLRALLRKVTATVAACAYTAWLGCAPTPWGAWLLAHKPRVAAPGRRRVLRPASLKRALDAAPVGLLPEAAGNAAAFEQIGCGTLGQLRALPRAGLRRRFGARLLDVLEQAYGGAPDPRDSFPAPAVFHAKLELLARVDTAAALSHAARRLLAQLGGWLSVRHAAVTQFALILKHEMRKQGARESRLTVAWTLPSCDPEHFGWLLDEQLNRAQLAAPVLELELVADQVSDHAPATGTLFPLPEAERQSVARLIERLGARLGPQHVMRLALHADHRPEAATVSGPYRFSRRVARAGAGPVTQAQAHPLPRPIWLLDAPQPLSLRQGRLYHRHSFLREVSGPERIEAGWWDGAGALRDYFVLADDHAQLYWVFRERPGGAWFLHGLFG